MAKSSVAFLVSVVAVVALIWAVSGVDNRPAPADATSGSEGDERPEVTLYCAASNRAVMEEVRTAYEEETGRRVTIQYGPSQTLLSQLEIAKTGDLYLPADDSFLKTAAKKGIVNEMLPLARMQVGLVVPKGNPQKIASLQDAIDQKLRIVQANPDAAAVAKLTRQFLKQAGTWKQLDEATTAYRTTVTDVANDLLVGAADVGIVYDAVLHTYPKLEFVNVPELADAASEIAVGVLDFSSQPAAALHFGRYVTATDRGLKNYAAHGFQTSAGDAWAEVPELSVYAGSMLRPAIEDTIVEFEKREGVRVSRVYNGCGILVSQMQAGQHPDAYFACDKEFMNQVTDLFPEPVDVSQNELVILVQKGNPHGIVSLRDLGKDNLRVGIGHEKQCAMGWITQNTLKEGGIQTEVMANVTVQTPTGDMLVNQMLTGSLDAAVVYLSNAAGAGEKLDALQIQGIECSTATQPWAVAEQSKYPQLASRLFATICSDESQEIFAAEGFRWQLPER
ncbi:MAG: molybdate ABC transporter substrate-binding protein [Planctomycetaceae bacterium]|nr:molybdate ABC transporter substrate-binding protein [Planctomycetaceae bacterium]